MVIGTIKILEYILLPHDNKLEAEYNKKLTPSIATSVYSCQLLAWYNNSLHFGGLCETKTIHGCVDYTK
jgi:hypothetical protein